jgi:metal-sulfur cluster biosynthetic enzyme
MHRDEREFTNLLICELPNGHFGDTMARACASTPTRCCCGRRLSASPTSRWRDRPEGAQGSPLSPPPLVDLGDTARRRHRESHLKMQGAIDRVWRFTGELFAPDPVADEMAASGSRRRPNDAVRPWHATSRTCWSGDAHRPTETMHRTGGRRDSTPTISGTCSPRCSGWPGRCRRLVVKTVTVCRRPARSALAAVTDPEIPVLTIEDLGIIRACRDRRNRAIVTITPTYSGARRWTSSTDIIAALEAEGFDEVEVRNGVRTGMDHRLDDRVRQAQTRGLRHRAPHPVGSAERPPVCAPVSPHRPTRLRVRIHRLQGPHGVQGCGEPFDYFKEL